MYESYRPKRETDSNFDQLVTEKIQNQTSNYASRLLVHYLLQPDFEQNSKNLKPRLVADIRLRSRDIVMAALHEEWDSLTTDDFPLHRYFGLPEPTPERLEGPHFWWKEPADIVLKEAEIEICESWVENIEGDFSELDDYHLDFAEKPELQNLVQKFIKMETNYTQGAADEAYRLVESAIFNPRQTLEYSGSQVILAYLPNHISGILAKLMGANQVLKEIDRLLPSTIRLEDEELQALEHITTILKGEVLSGIHWYRFASRCGSVKTTGREMALHSHQMLKSINELTALVRRNQIGCIGEVYNAANTVAADAVLSMAEYLPQKKFWNIKPTDLADAQGSEHLDLLFAGQNFDKHPRFRPVKSDLKAVIVEESLTLALAWRDYTESLSVYKIDEDTIFRDLGSINSWLDDPSVGRCMIDLDVDNLVQQLDAVHEIIALRSAKLSNESFPSFDLILWSINTDNLLKAESYLRSSLFLDERVNYHAMVGDITIRGPYEPMDSNAKVHIRVIPKGIRIPDGNLPFVR